MPSSQQTINIMVGTAGHIDHGKTELVKLLTGCDTDRLKEEKQRGMSIDLGFAPCTLADNVNVGIVDVPGHERFIRNMVAGASSIDVVLLVVAADDGVMPQTREHFEVVQLLGVQRGLIALTKIDLVDQARRDQAARQIRDFVKGTFLQDAAIVGVSSITGEGFDGFYEALNKVLAQTPRRNTQGVFRLPIERVFAVKGYGTVVTGVPAGGQVRLGDQLELIRVVSDQQNPNHRVSCRVRGLQVFGRDTDVGLAGECVAVNIANVPSAQITRGDALVAPGYFQPAQILTSQLTLLKRMAKSLPRRTPVAVHVGTSERQGKAVLLDRNELSPGDSAPVQLILEEPVVAGPQDRFVIRTHSPRMTIGGGLIVDTTWPKQRKFRPNQSDLFRSRLQSLGDPQATILCLARQADIDGIANNDLQLSAQLTPERFSPCLQQALADGTLLSWDDGRMIIHHEAVCRLQEELLAQLKSQHQAQPKKSAFAVDELGRSLTVSPALLAVVVAAMLKNGQLKGDAWNVALPDAQYEPAGLEKQAVVKVEQVYRRCAARPPKSEELPRLAGLDQAAAQLGFDILIDRGTLLRISDKFAMHSETVEQARQVLVNHLREHRELVSAEYKTLIDSERKFAIALLDYFDRLGISIRRGNSRFLGGKPDAALRSLVTSKRNSRK